MNKDLIISKYKELVSRHQSFSRWIIKHNPEILESERGRNFIAECEDIESELSLLQEQDKKELHIDKNYVAMDKVNEICDKAEHDIELENKLIDFANWYLRLIKVTTDKDERYEIENREIVWSFLRGDDYKLWWNKFGESVDQSGIRDELIKFAKWYYEWKEIEVANEHTEWVINEYLKSNQ